MTARERECAGRDQGNSPIGWQDGHHAIGRDDVSGPIHRERIVRRHNPVLTAPDAFDRLSVGNGEFAFTADLTGLQTFDGPTDGLPLCTQAQWGWHTTPEPGMRDARARLVLEPHHAGDRTVGYATSAAGQEESFRWLRENPHRLHLGRIGLWLAPADMPTASADPADSADAAAFEDPAACLAPSGRPAVGDTAWPADETGLEAPRQELDLWSGLLESRFGIAGAPIRTQACCHPKLDLVSFRIAAEGWIHGRLGVVLDFPYGSPSREAADWTGKHPFDVLPVQSCDDQVLLACRMDDIQWFVTVGFPPGSRLERLGRNRYAVLPSPASDRLDVSVRFHREASPDSLPGFDETRRASAAHWARHWSEGGFVTLDGSLDPRAEELERRIILSQYQLAVHCAGSLPPQETGLACNSWYGKFHLEMHWWHGVHFVLWNRPSLFERSLAFYGDMLEQARALAASQGYRGARWPKMTDPSGADSPSPIGPLLVWQQPHPIYYAELLRRSRPGAETLAAYSGIVFETASFMADYVRFDAEGGRYVLGPALIPAQENHAPGDVLNPTFELAYWAFGLRTAAAWRARMGLEPVPAWTHIADRLARLPVAEGCYLAHERCPDTFTRFTTDHPAMLAALGMLPGEGVDAAVMAATLDRVLSCWQFDTAWGWDFPLMAMTAARLGRPMTAVELLLMQTPKNRYSRNGHNRQGDERALPLYLPGNGALLAAVALMAAGWDGCERRSPGFPDDGSFRVHWENLSPMP